MPCLPDARSDQQHHRGGANAKRETTETRTNPGRHRNGIGDPPHGRKKRQEAARQERDEKGQEHVPGQVRGNERVARRVSKERRLSHDGDEDRVRNDAGQKRWNERVGFEIVSVKDLDGEKRGAERSTKHRRHATRHASDEQNAALPRGDLEVTTDERAEGTADLHRGALASARTAGPEGQDRSQGLDRRHASANRAALVVEGVQHRITSPPRASGARKEVSAPPASAPSPGKIMRSHGRKGPCVAISTTVSP